ncbi:hypothetical protein V8C86DRAFT_1250861 [Haematococcus lacustris]
MLAALQEAIADLEPALLEVARDRLLRSCDSASLQEEEEEEAEEEEEEEWANGSGEGVSAEGEEEEEEEEEEALQHSGLGAPLDVFAHARLAVEAGVHKGTLHYAAWEQHSRGIASKLLAAMGYVKGSGLGSRGTGRVEPLQVLLQAGKQGLGRGQQGQGEAAGDRSGRKRKRGGERSRRRKHAAAAAAAKEGVREQRSAQEAAGGAPGLFAFINASLGDSSEAAAKIRAVEASLLRQDRVSSLEGGSGRGLQRGPAAAARPDTRQRLMDQHGRVDKCQQAVAHFTAMLQRNRDNPSLAAQVSRRLREAQASLAGAEAEASRMSRALRDAGSGSKMKF